MKSPFKKMNDGWEMIWKDLSGKNGTEDLLIGWLLLSIIIIIILALLVGGIFVIPGIIAASFYCGITCIGGMIAYIERRDSEKENNNEY